MAGNAATMCAAVEKAHQRRQSSAEERPATGEYIVGYEGYRAIVKPENIYGKTFGAVAERVHQLYDIQSERHLSSEQFNTLDTRTVHPKTVAECVGVAARKPEYRKPTSEDLHALSETVTPCHLTEPEAGKSGEYRVKKAEALQETKTYIINAIPGYTGHRSAVYSQNIHGKTFKECKETAQNLIAQKREEDEAQISVKLRAFPPLH